MSKPRHDIIKASLHEGRVTISINDQVVELHSDSVAQLIERLRDIRLDHIGKW